MLYKLELNRNDCVDDLWEKLSVKGFNPLYSTEEAHATFLYVEVSETLLADWETLAKSYPGCIQEDLPKTDWNAQWAIHAPGYKEGYAHIDLNEFGVNEIVRLIPGPGFGDLSHPTTHMMLQLISKYVNGKEVVDIGSGSGILTICALRLGAKEAFGIEIDHEALSHSSQNALLNNLSDVNFYEPHEDILESFSDETVALMNMIWSEQQVAYEAFCDKGGKAGIWITSGILTSEKERYLQWCLERRWTLKEHLEEGEWSSFVFEILEVQKGF